MNSEMFDDDIADIFGLTNTPNPPPPVDNSVAIIDNSGSSMPTVVSYPVAPSTPATIAVAKEIRILDVATDYDFARKTMQHSIEQGSKSLTDLVYFAANSGGPEAYKQVSSVMDAITRSTKQLLDIQKQMNEIIGSTMAGTATKPEKAVQHAQSITNNTIIEAPKDSSYADLTREEAMAKRAAERLARAQANEKVVN